MTEPSYCCCKNYGTLQNFLNKSKFCLLIPAPLGFHHNLLHYNLPPVAGETSQIAPLYWNNTHGGNKIILFTPCVYDTIKESFIYSCFVFNPVFYIHNMAILEVMTTYKSASISDSIKMESRTESQIVEGDKSC